MYVNDNILGREQADFREGYSTIDHAFVLHLVIELYQSVRNRVFCDFIDYRKAFDTMISYYCMYNIGVRQGENLSPVLFALVINDCIIC